MPLDPDDLLDLLSQDLLEDGDLRRALERLLMRAGIVLTKDDRGRIHACEDTAILDVWIDNVFGAKTAADVLT